jgi:hypothetical protein
MIGLAKSVMRSMGILYEDENKVHHLVVGKTEADVTVFWKMYCKHTMSAVAVTQNNRITRLSKVFEGKCRRDRSSSIMC